MLNIYFHTVKTYFGSMCIHEKNIFKRLNNVNINFCETVLKKQKAEINREFLLVFTVDNKKLLRQISDNMIYFYKITYTITEFRHSTARSVNSSSDHQCPPDRAGMSGSQPEGNIDCYSIKKGIKYNID